MLTSFRAAIAAFLLFVVPAATAAADNGNSDPDALLVWSLGALSFLTLAFLTYAMFKDNG
ncbi:hypothetical protein B0H94_103161 [Salsuginibacillus halophilus]|uniref:Uncharacterized protein n=1 Tax=Salsuginibacillus halophilus TaxID=517424 RepID=A0A2P8HWE4_9BACI|nr:hypothetical protein [Salsuginibacillus halophilus]PSL50549.1 hypothetical protein B0H94_103161 [Salsuginibacillus halophilus]